MAHRYPHLGIPCPVELAGLDVGEDEDDDDPAEARMLAALLVTRFHGLGAQLNFLVSQRRLRLDHPLYTTRTYGPGEMLPHPLASEHAFHIQESRCRDISAPDKLERQIIDRLSLWPAADRHVHVIQQRARDDGGKVSVRHGKAGWDVRV